MLLDIGGRQLAPGFHRHRRHNRFACAGGVADSNDGGLPNSCVLVQDLLDVAGHHVEALASWNDLLDAAQDVDEAVLGDPSDITTADESAVRHDLLRLLRIREIPHHHQSGPGANLPNTVLLRWWRHARAGPAQVFNDKVLRKGGFAGTAHSEEVFCRCLTCMLVELRCQTAHDQVFRHAVRLCEGCIGKLPHAALDQCGGEARAAISDLLHKFEPAIGQLLNHLVHRSSEKQEGLNSVFVDEL
mmetsp:Transcript_133179/g.425907  ORF Transcript_133179/g.425907 Transcript_133179/m.425907 type:complete len:244 (+) Transcript_133179:635-1366(+)